MRGPFERSIEGLGELCGAPGDGGVEQRLLRGVPVQDRLLGQTQLVAQGVERGRVESPGAEERSATSRIRWSVRTAAVTVAIRVILDKVSTIW